MSANSQPPAAPRHQGTKQPTVQGSAKKRQRGPDLYAYPLPLLLPLSRQPASTSLADLLAPLLRRLANVSPENPKCRGTWDAVTKSVWVTGVKDLEVLWRRGFWGKGSLSRSEPTWLQRARNRRALELDAEKQHLRLTAEEVTAQRRIERREMKILKAKEKAAAGTASLASSSRPGTPSQPTIDSTPAGPVIISSIDTPAASQDPSVGSQQKPVKTEMPPELKAELDAIENAEHLQIMREEAFFLLWGLDCMSIVRPETEVEEADDDPSLPLSILSTWRLFLSSCCPTPSNDITIFHPSNPFLISYAVFHHFRSLGWVVRSGIKFCVDFILYGPKGPVGAHAEFAVCVMPQYEDPEDDPARAEGTDVDLSQDRRSWRWFSTTNRIASGVKKTLVFAYVTVPSSRRCTPDIVKTPACLDMFRVQEVVVRRFLPARMRD